MFGLLIFTVFLQIAIPALIIFLIVRFFVNRHKKKSTPITYLEILRWTILLAAGYCGIAGITTFPYAVIGSDVESNTLVITYLLAGMLLLLAGLALKELTGKFLMVLGTLLLLIGIVPVFDAFGSSGAFAAVLAAFVVLIVIAVRMSRKANRHG